MSLVGVVTNVTSAITGAVVSGVVVLSLSVVVEVVAEPSSLLLLQEMIVRLIRNMDKMMSICLTRFPISGLGELNLYLHLVNFTMCVGFNLECV